VRLRCRTTRPSDLDQCVAIAADGCLYDRSALVALRTMWLDLLVCDVARSAVVVKAESPERIVAFGIAAAVERRRFDVLKAGCEPFVARRMVHEWCAGGKPFLNEQQYANANAGDGVNVFAFPLGVNVDAVDTSDEETARTVFVALVEAFGKQHAGLNVSTFAQELFGWFPKLSRDAEPTIRFYDGTYEERIAQVPVDRRPFLLLKTRTEIERQPTHAWASTFLRPEAPRFAFKAELRRLLRHALEDESDDALSDVLSLSTAALKKRWLRIYEAMQSVLPSGAQQDCGRRGGESRRHVIRYLREHPEELHPYPSSCSNRPRSVALGKCEVEAGVYDVPQWSDPDEVRIRRRSLPHRAAHCARHLQKAKKDQPP